MSLAPTLSSSPELPETPLAAAAPPGAFEASEAHRRLARAALAEIAPRLDLSSLVEARALRRPSAPARGPALARPR